ncbi:MAG TPA: D-glucuronyl C5-epimerase family protein [Thermoleophilaceae bacterium]|nr:D-glucuronyl C5-epimerase family protein [Thermoleophilaceae bacterium]
MVVIAVLVGALGGAQAEAAPVIEVHGGRAVRIDDPFVPARSASHPRPPRVRGARAGAARSAAASSARGRRAVRRALVQAVRKRKVRRSSSRRWRRGYAAARRTVRRLSGARRAQLAYVIRSVERLALSRRLNASRMPVAFIQLERNRRYWRSLPYPASGDRVSFAGSEILFEYFPGRGLQLHPLSTFKKANLIHGACVREESGCDRGALATLLDEMERLAVRRARSFIAWEYMFDFGGGAPPWISGMAEATAIQAFARAADLLDQPRYVKTARRALGAFATLPPVGVRAVGPAGGIHYLQYSFAPRLWIFNAFLQSLIGLHDYAELTGNERARKLFDDAEPEAREELPFSDVGDWSRYSYRGAESSRDYHELLREFLQSMCNRRLGRPYCTYARRYRGYQTDPPVLKLNVPGLTRKGDLTAIRFRVSKLSAVEVTISKGQKVALNKIGTFRRGSGSFLWRPRSRGLYTVRLGAKELRTGLGLKDRGTTEIEVEPDPDA